MEGEGGADWYDKGRHQPSAIDLNDFQASPTHPTSEVPERPSRNATPTVEHPAGRESGGDSALKESDVSISESSPALSPNLDSENGGQTYEGDVENFDLGSINSTADPQSIQKLQSILEQFDPLGQSSPKDTRGHVSNPPESPLSVRSVTDSVHRSVSTTSRKPTPEPDKPFDFQRFLDQLRQKSADPVAKYMKSFLTEFGRKQWAVNEQRKIVNDFLAFIAQKMALYAPWKSISSQEFDNAVEGMEKLIMNKLYNQTFSPAVVAAGLGHNTGHSDDLDRDQVVAEKLDIYHWIKESHLDIQESPLNARFLRLAQHELLKMDNYRAPRDKVICVLNCCKVIFGLLRHAGLEESADKFVPVLIFVVLKSRANHIVSNVQYISRFRDPSKLEGEAGYYLSSLIGAIQYIENLDRASIGCTDEEFERNVEASVARIAARNEAEQPEHDGPSVPIDPQQTRNVLAPTKDFISKNSESAFNALSRPLSSIGRIFSEPHTPTGEAMTSDRIPKTENGSQRDSLTGLDSGHRMLQTTNEYLENQRLSSDEAAARAASIEQSNIASISAQERMETLSTLVAMFPSVERDVVEMVIEAKGGRVGPCVDSLLEMA